VREFASSPVGDKLLKKALIPNSNVVADKMARTVVIYSFGRMDEVAVVEVVEGVIVDAPGAPAAPPVV